MTPTAILVLAVVAQPPPADATRPADGPAAYSESEKTLLAEYQARLKRLKRTADSQYELASWCKDRGLVEESYAHASAAIAIDPKKDAAWLLLGYHKLGGRWMSLEQARDEAEQRVADREWGPKLMALHRTIHAPAKKGKAVEQQAVQVEAAWEALGKIEDGRAVRAVYREFARGGPEDQEIAVQVLGQIPAARASQALAAIAIYGSTGPVRRLAGETLRQRKPGDYLEGLLGLLRSPLRYTFVPDDGTPNRLGYMGHLQIEDEHHILSRGYLGVGPFRNDLSPDLTIRQGDMISYDAQGFPVINRKGGGMISTRQVAERIDQEYRNLTAAAREQLAGDIARIEAENSARRAFNDVILLLLKGATGKDFGEDRRAWVGWLADSQGLPRPAERPEHKRTFFQNVKPYEMALPWASSLAFLSGPYEGIPFT